MASGEEVHDTYVYQQRRRWFWTCPCGTSAGPFTRRMDADDDATRHEEDATRPDPSSPDFVFCAIPFVDVGCARCDHRPEIHGKVLVGCEHAHCGCRAYHGDAFVVVDWCALAADHDGSCVPSGDPWIVATSVRTWQHVRAATPV